MDKTWVEDPPSRIPYESLYQQPDAEEEKTDKIFIGLIVIIILGLCYCGYDVSIIIFSTFHTTINKRNTTQ